MRQDAGIVFRVRRDFRDCDVTRRVDEFLELPVCHRMAIDPEPVDRHAMDRRFLRIVLVGAHAERAAGDPDHVLMIRRVRDMTCNVGAIDAFLHEVVHRLILRVTDWRQ